MSPAAPKHHGAQYHTLVSQMKTVSQTLRGDPSSAGIPGAACSPQRVLHGGPVCMHSPAQRRARTFQKGFLVEGHRRELTLRRAATPVTAEIRAH